VRLIRPGEPGYDRFRAVFDHRVVRRPAAIAVCETPRDAAEAVAYADDRGLPIAVRSGAADASATLDGGLVIEVSGLKELELDPAARQVRVGGGVTWAELDAATQAHGLAVTGGRVSWMGVAGVAVGEGSGWLERALGFTGDNLLATDLAGPVATGLTLRLHPCGPELLCGFLSFPGARAREVAVAYRELMEGAPAEVGGALSVYTGRAGACQVAFCFLGDPVEGERWVRPLRELRPGLDAVGVNPYTAFQVMTDTQQPFGMRCERRVHPLGGLPDDLLDAVLEAAARPSGSALSRVVLRPRGGVLDGAPWMCECLALWPPVPSLDAANLAWADRVEGALTGAAVGT
jgi:hypothetical protein